METEKNQSTRPSAAKMIIIIILSLIALAGIYLIISYKFILWPFSVWSGPARIPDINAKTDQIHFELLYKTTMGFLNKGTQIIESQSSLEALWPNIIPYGSNTPLPQVDFSREKVAVIALGDSSACTEIVVDQIYRQNDKIIIAYNISNYEDGCPCTMKLAKPLQVVKFSAANESIEFISTPTIRECWVKPL